MAQVKKSEYLLQENGAVLRRLIYEDELDLSQAWLNAMCKEMEGKCRNVYRIPDVGSVSMTISADEKVHFCVKLDRLMIRAPWRLDEGKGVLIPMFNSKTDPVLTMKWVPPSSLRLAMIVAAYPSSGMYYWNGSWLFALDKNNGTWRLPIANVHDDGSCCTGVSGGSVAFPTAAETLAHMLQNFDTAQYNADLWKNAETTHLFFKMKPVKEEYITDPPPTRWTDYCTKIGTAISKYVVV